MNDRVDMAADKSIPARLLSNRNFVLLWLAYGISAFGDHLSELALLKLQHAMDPGVTDLTRRSAIMLFTFFVPFCLLGPVFGYLADRLPRRGLMIFADTVRAIIIFQAMSILMHMHHRYHPTDAANAPLSIGMAIIPLAALGLFAAMFSPARLSFLPTLVRTDQLVRANASTSGVGLIASIASFYVGAYLVDHFGPQANFHLDAATFVFSAVCVLAIRPPRLSHQVTGRSESNGFTDGFRYVRGHRKVVELILICTLFWAAASVIRSIVPAMVKVYVSAKLQDVGIYQGLLGVGILFGSIVLTLIGPALKSELAISWSLKFAGVGALALLPAMWRHWPAWVFACLIIAIGFFGAGIIVSINALLQTIVPDRMRGRVFGITDWATMLGLLLATGALGIPNWPHVDQYIGVITAGTGLSLLIAGLVMSWIRLQRGRFGLALTFWINLTEFYCKLIARVRRDGLCTVPPNGPVILAANHCSGLDPFLLIATSPNRYVSFMIAAEFARIPLFSRLVKLAHCVPVNRTGNDIASVRAALKHLEGGNCLGIFPEGRIRLASEPLRLRDGVGMLALKSGATIIPAYISGVENTTDVARPFLHMQHAVVRYGKPVDLSPWKDREKDRGAHREVTEHIYAAICALATDNPPTHVAVQS